RLDESLPIQCHTSRHPLRARLGARHGEHVSNVMRLNRSTSPRTPGHTLEMSISLQADNLGPGMLLDTGMRIDAADQVPGHRVRKGIRPNQHVHALGAF